jgi:hypothetical protein
MASEEDDDGNEASKPSVKTVPKSEPAPKPKEAPKEEAKFPPADKVFTTPAKVIDEIQQKFEADKVSDNRTLVNQDFFMPVGSKTTKGKRLRDLSEATIKSAIEWMRNNQPEKYAEAIKKCEDYLDDSGLPF